MTKILTPKMVSLLILLVLLAAILMNTMMVPRFYDFKIGVLEEPESKDKSISLPFTGSADKGNTQYRVTGKLDFKPFQRGRFRITPDNCIEVLKINDKDVNLDNIARAQRCDYVNGFGMDLRPYLQVGANTIFIHLADDGVGSYGINIEPAN